MWQEIEWREIYWREVLGWEVCGGTRLLFGAKSTGVILRPHGAEKKNSSRLIVLIAHYLFLLAHSVSF